MNAGEREHRLQRLRRISDGERGVLTNARCLNEGVDVPTLDGVAFIDPRRSQVDVVQAVGRAIRKAYDKTVGTVVIPVFVDSTVDPEKALEASEFDRVWQVVRALRDHDEDLAEQLDALRRQLGVRGTTGKRPSKIVIDLPRGVDATFARAFDTRIVERSTARWEEWFGRLSRFAERSGTARVAYRCNFEGTNLGLWVAYQRRNRGRLDQDKVRRLESLPGWVWDPSEGYWLDGINALRAFISQYHHADVVQKYVDKNGFRLGSFVSHAREARRAGNLPDERVSDLESIPGWQWDPRQVSWDRGFAQMRAFSEANGHCRLRRGQRVNGYDLAGWAQAQRAAYKRGRLTEAQIARLEGLRNWRWTPYSQSWERGYEILATYAAAHGNTRVPSECEIEGFKLGTWVSTQRFNHSRGLLTRNRVRRLEQLPRWAWNTLDARWETGLQLLQEYESQHGDLDFPRTYEVNGFKLGLWISNQRVQYRKKSMSPERIARLESLASWKWHDDRWSKAFVALQQYARETGHSSPGMLAVVDGVRIGNWVSHQREVQEATCSPRARRSSGVTPQLDMEPADEDLIRLRQQWPVGVTLAF